MPFNPASGARVGNYRLTDAIGAGGMGVVYRAEHVASGEAAAVKVFRQSERNARDLARFYHEARVLESLKHPNIVECREILSVDGTPCLIMEYVGGPSLAGRLAGAGRIPPDEALTILASVARGVDYAHARGVVHRDIKPDNVRFTASGRLKLLDFGIAKSAHGQRLTDGDKVIGTPQYLAPELLAGGKGTGAADVWALGVLLFEMVTGRPPFSDATPEALWKAVHGPAPLLAGDDSGVARVNQVLAACFVADPRRRTTTAAAIAEMAGAPDDGRDEPVTVGRSRWRSWLPPWGLSRGRAAAVAGLAVALFAAWMFWPSGESIPPNELGILKIEANRRGAVVFINGSRFDRVPCEYRGRIGTTIEVRVESDNLPPQTAIYTLNRGDQPAQFTFGGAGEFVDVGSAGKVR